MAGPETLSDKPKPDAAKTSASADDAAKYVGTPAVGTSKAAAAAGVATVGPKDDQVKTGVAVLCGVQSPVFSAPGLSPSSASSCRAHSSSPPPFSKLAI